MGINGTMLQYFEWYLPSDCSLWTKLQSQAQQLKLWGYTSVWLPPAYKGAGGKNDVGYGVYDLYDLGEFDQKGSVPTKYGTKAQFLAAVDACHRAGVQVYADVVLNHKMGADETEQVMARTCDESDREKIITDLHPIQAWTKFTFPGRDQKYSSFVWDHSHFDGTDWDEASKKNHIYLLEGKQWQDGVDIENGNYDYLMGADIDFDNPQVLLELTAWGKWFLDQSDVDGFRIDAVKHIKAEFYKNWLPVLRRMRGRELFSVGEYWHTDVQVLKQYLNHVDGDMSLFDVPLHFNLYRISKDPQNSDLRLVFENTLVSQEPTKSVCFVDNHDTQPGQALESFVLDWFKPHAYALILLRESGYPCVFYGDLMGIPHGQIAPVAHLSQLVSLRSEKAYGPQHDFFISQQLIGFTREGDGQHEKSGLAALLSTGQQGEIAMYVGKGHAGAVFCDQCNPESAPVTIDDQGYGNFFVGEKQLAVYVQK